MRYREFKLVEGRGEAMLSKADMLLQGTGFARQGFEIVKAPQQGSVRGSITDEALAMVKNLLAKAKAMGATEPASVTPTMNPADVDDSEFGESQEEPQAISAGPPYPQEDMDRVRAMQSKLEDLGYSVGSTGADGKFGPRTTRAVRAFKQDNDISTQANVMSAQELSTLASAQPVENPTNVDQPSTGGDVSDLAGDEDLIARTRQTVEEFIGREITDNEFNYLIRASAAEASSNAQERAGVAAVMLNRARLNHNGYGRSIIDQLEAGGQFQAVTGVRRNGNWTGPHSNFSDMSSRTGGQVMAAIVRYLSRMDRTWRNFTSNNPRAYGRGTNINFMYAMRQAPDAQVIGQTVFGTA